MRAYTNYLPELFLSTLSRSATRTTTKAVSYFAGSTRKRNALPSEKNICTFHARQDFPKHAFNARKRAIGYARNPFIRKSCTCEL